MTLRMLNKNERRLADRLAVPDWGRGAWKRLRIRLDGEVERTTRIVWVQTPLLFADIRVPGPRDTGGQAEGFAGHLVVRGQVFSWQRPIDLQPPKDPGDEGAMFRDGDAMVEAGIHANYVEDWKLVGAAEPHLAMSRGHFEITRDGILWDDAGPLEIAVACGGHVIHAWRDDAGAGLAYFAHNPQTDTLKPKLRAGAQDRAESGEPWRLWSTTMDEASAEALADMLA
jgi:hypothetical protein